MTGYLRLRRDDGCVELTAMSDAGDVTIVLCVESARALGEGLIGLADDIDSREVESPAASTARLSLATPISLERL